MNNYSQLPAATNLRATLDEQTQELVNNKVLDTLESGSNNQKLWNTYVIQRYFIAQHFEALLEKAIDMAGASGEREKLPMN